MVFMNKISELFTPREKLDSIYDISFEYLQGKGIKGFVLDVDNTLLSPETINPSLKCVQWIERAQGHGFKVCLISNDFNPKRVSYLADVLKVPAIHSALKPLTWNVENAITEVLGLSPQEVAVIGDTLMTDILPGNWLKAHTILVGPIAEQEDAMIHWLTRHTGDAIAKVITKKK